MNQHGSIKTPMEIRVAMPSESHALLFKEALKSSTKESRVFGFFLLYLATLSTVRANRAFLISAYWNRNTKELIYKYSV